MHVCELFMTIEILFSTSRQGCIYNYLPRSREIIELVASIFLSVRLSVLLKPFDLRPLLNRDVLMNLSKFLFTVVVETRI